MSIKREKLIPLIFFFVIFISSILVHILGFAGLDSSLETAFGSDGSSSSSTAPTTSTTTTLAITSFTLKDRVSGSTSWTKSTTVSWEVVLDGPFTDYQVTEEGAVPGNYIPIVGNKGTFTFSNSTNGTKHAYYYGKLGADVASGYAQIGLDTVAPTVTVTAPITGESLAAGSSYSLTRTVTDATSGVKTNSLNWRYSTDGGATWNTIATGQGNQNYTWTVTTETSTNCMISLEAQDNAGNVGVGNSGIFTIFSTEYYVDAVNGSNLYNGLTTEVSAPNGPWKTITYAATQAATGSTIHVAPGTYNAALGESFPITLTGKKLVASTTYTATLDAAGAAAHDLSLGANATVEGMTLTKSADNYDVINSNSNNVTVNNNKISGTGQTSRGVHITGSAQNSKITNNTFTSISGWNSSPIYFEGTTSGASIESNNINGGYWNSVYLNGLTNASLINNTITNSSSGYDKTGVQVTGSTNLLIFGNTITADNTIYLSGTNTSPIIRQNVSKLLSDNRASIIYLTGTLNNVATIELNEINGTTIYPTNGIYVNTSGSPTLDINRNTIINNYNALLFETSFNGTANIKNNIICGSPLLNSYLDNSYGIYQKAGTVNSSYNNLFNLEYTYSGTVGNKSNDLTTSPRFVSASTNDFRLYSDSPAKNSGDTGGNRGAYTSVAGSSGILSESYVSTSGSDSTGTGSIGSPWRTITYATSSTEGTVFARGGYYNAGESFPIYTNYNATLVKRYAAETVTIESTTSNTIYVAPYTTVESLYITNSNGSNGNNNCIYVAGQNAQILNNTLTRNSYSGDGGKMYVTGANLLLQGNTITGGWSGVQFTSGGNNATIRNNNISGGADGVTFYGSSGLSYLAENNTIECRTCWQIGDNNAYIRNNYFNGDWYGITTSGSSRVSTIESNTILGGTAFYVNGGYCYYNIVNNVISAEGTAGIFINSFWGANTNISSNEIRGATDATRGGIYFADGDGTFNIFNNTIVQNAVGLNVNSVRAGSTVTAYNNIIASEVGGYSVSGSKGIRNNSGTGTVTSKYNDLNANDTTYEGTVADKTGDINKDAKFIAASSNNYSLNSNSPCIDTGDPTSPIDPDGSRADIGDYRYNQTTSATICANVRSPNGGESLTGLGTFELTWYATDDGRAIDHIELYYSTDSGASYSAITTNTANDGSYVWTIPNLTTTQGRVRVVAIGTAGTDESDSDFSITSTDVTGPTIEVTAPTSSTKWQGGSTQNITFTVTDESGIKPNSLDIYYSTDGVPTYSNLITSDAAVTSPYSWSVPVINSNQVKVRVRAKDNSAQYNYGTGESTGNFIIDSTGPTVTVTIPATGEMLASGASYNLTWEAADSGSGLATNPITLRYSTNGGSSWTQIAANQPNATYAWTVPSAASATCRISIEAVDAAGNIGTAMTPGNFTIDNGTPGAPTLTTPTNSSTTNDATPLLTWEAAAPTTSGNGSFEITLDSTRITIEATNSYYITGTLADGLHTWEVRTRNRAGTWGTSSGAWTFSVLTSNPTVDSIAVKDTATGSTTYTNKATVSVEASGVTGSPTEMIISQEAGFGGASWVSYSANTTYPLGGSDASKTVYYKVRNTVLAESSPRNASITLDRVSPEVTGVTITDTTANSTTYTKNGNSVTLTATVTDTNQAAMTTTNIAANLTSLGGGAAVNPISYNTGTGLATWASITVSGTTTGGNSVVVTATDPAVNVKTGSGSITADNVNPGAPTQIRPTNGSSTNEASPVLTWEAAAATASGNGSFEVTLDSTKITIEATNSYYTTSSLANGLHTWEVRTRNNVGAWGTSSGQWTFTVDNTSATVENVTSSTANGTYTSGATIPIQITFSKNLNVTGTPQLTLNTTPSRTINYTGGTGSATLEFTYIVPQNDTTNTNKLDYAATGSLTLNGGTIKDTVGNNATLTLAAPGAAKSLSANKNIIIDAISPTVLSVGASSPANGTYGVGQTITVTIECSENVTVTGQPSITMETGTTDRRALYSGGSGSSTLSFMYTVEAGDTSSDLDYVATDSLVGGVIVDGASNSLTRTLATPGAAGSLGANRAYVILTTPPAGSIKLKDRVTGSQTITNNQRVTVEATITSGVPTLMRISEEASLAGAAWTAYVNPTTYNFMTSTNELKRVYYNVSDEAANITTFEATIRLDTIAPTVTVEAPNGGEVVNGGGTYNITWSATDEGGLKTNPITLRYSQDSGATWTQIATSLANTGTYSWSVPVINKTTCRVSVEAEDSVGQIGTDMSNADFTITSGGPAASTLLTPANNSYTSSLSPTFSWTASVDAVAYEATIGTSVTTQTATSYTPTLTQGAYTWKVRSKNLTGTWGSDSATWTVTVDATAPTVAFNPLISDISPIVLRTMAATTNTTNPKPTLTGTATDNFAVSSVEVRLDGGSWVSGEITSGIGTTSAPFKYVYTGALLTQGTHTIEGRAYDLAGNVTSPLGLMEFNVTPAERTVTVTSARATVVNNGLVTVRPTFTIAINSSSYPISALTVKWGQDSTSDIPYTLKTIASEFTETSFDVTPIADLIANTPYKLSITGTDTRGDFDASITGLKYEAKYEIKIPVTTVTPGQPGEPARVNLEFQSSGLGDADLYIYDSSNIQVKHLMIPSINVGKNDISLSLLSDAGVTLGRGIYRYFLKYENDAPIEGAFFVQ